MFRNKKILLMFLLLTFLLSFTVVSNASFNVNYNDSDVVLPDIPSDIKFDHYVLLNDGYNKAYSMCFLSEWTDNSKLYRTGVNNKYITYDGVMDVYFCYFNDPTKWVHFGTINSINTGGDFSILMVSTDDIYQADKETVFFSGIHPQLTPLQEIVQGAKMEKTIQPIIAIIPMILVVVVSLIGFRKAWALLSKLLHRA